MLSQRVLEHVWQQVVDRHAALRTAFLWDDVENLLQVVYQHAQVSLTRYDWRGILLNDNRSNSRFFCRRIEFRALIWPKPH